MKKNSMRLLGFLLMAVMMVSLLGLGVFAEDTATPVATAEGNVAKVGSTEYATIDEAIANWKAGTTLTLLDDVTLSDVIELSSIEYHVLDLGTYTMTAASKKDAIQIVNNGRSSASYALDIKADAENPGGITATGKAIVRHSGSTKDRPIIRFYGGVFNASYIVYHSGTNGAKAPHFYFYGGEFNGTIFTNRSLNQFHGGTFNGSLMMSVDSSSYTLIRGGTFKQLSNLYMSALNSDKFTIGSAKGVYDREVYVNDDGYYVVSTSAPTEVEASVVMTPDTNNYFAYSKVAAAGKMDYTSVYAALTANKSGKVTVYVTEIDLTGTTFKGTILLPEADSVLTVTFAEGTTPAWVVATEIEGKKVVFTDSVANGVVTRTYKVVDDKPYVAQVGDTLYESLKEAFEACTNGETVKLIDDITYEADDVVYAHGGATGFGNYDQYNPSIIYIGGTKGATEAENQPSNVNAVLDLNGHTITSNADAYMFLFMDNCKVTFVDSVGGGKVVNNSTNYPAIWSTGSETLVTIQGGTYQTASALGLIHATHSGDLVIEGGHFSTTADDASLLLMINSQQYNNPNYFLKGVATLTVKGGTFVGFNPEKVGDDYGASSIAEIKFVNGCPLGYVANDNGDGTYGVEEWDLVIRDIDDLLRFAAMVNAGNTFAGETVLLDADINLAGLNWTPIGNDTNYFCGNFDGQDHTISNMTIDVNTPDANQFVGLFGGVKKATIKNLTMTNVNIDVVGAKVRAAAVVGIAHSNSENRTDAAINFENITVNGCTINAQSKSGSALIGGVVGYCYPANLANIDVSGLTIDAKADGSNEVRAAAILGYLCGQNISNNGSTRAAMLVDTFNVENVSITADAYTVFAGGYAPYTYYGYITLKDGTIDGLEIDVDAHEAFVGGLVGYFWRSDNGHNVQNVHISNIDFDVTTDYLGETRVGGMVGTSQSPNTKYTDCSVSGKIVERCSDPANPVNYHAKVGGFVARTYEYAQQTYTNCVADVDITATNIAGGFVGNHNSTVSYVNCEAHGDVTAATAGGFAGRLTEHGYTTDVTFDGCSASGVVTGTDVAGGFIGSTANHGWAAWTAGNGTAYGKNVTIKNCTASSNVTSDTEYCAGIIGEFKLAEGKTLTLENVSYSVEPPYYPTEVAQIGDVKYWTLADAIAAANAAENGATITLLADATVGEMMTIAKDVIIEGNGKTITWADGYNGTIFNVESGVSVTLKNLTIDGENSFTFYDDTTTVEDGQNWYTRFVDVGEEDKAINDNVIVNAGNLTLDSVRITGVTIASDGDNGKTANTETGGFYLMYNDDIALIKSNGGSVTLSRANLSGNAGMVLNAINAKTVIENSIIDGNFGCGNKGGIIIASGGTMELNNASICGNKAMARSATVLGVINGAEVAMNGNTRIDNNKHIGVGSNTAGAIVCLEGASQFVMNGGSISNNIGGRAGAIASRWVGGSHGQHEDTSIVLNAGTITGNSASNDSWNGASVFLRSPATIGEGMKIDGTIAVNAAPGALEITGGTFTGSLTVTDGLVAEITGGTFDYDPTEWVAEGYEATDNGDGTYGVVLAKLAKVEVEMTPGNWDTNYVTIENWADLVAALGENTNVPVKVTLLEDIELTDEGRLTIAGTAKKVIDLNGHTITGMLVNYAELIVNDETQNGKIEGGPVAIDNYGALTVNGGFFTGKYGAIYNNEMQSGKATVVIYGGEFTALGDWYATIQNEYGVLTVNGGKIVATNRGGYAIVDTYGETTINGGEIVSADGTAVETYAGKIIITDGSFVGKVIVENQAGNVTVYGGTLVSNTPEYYYGMTNANSGVTVLYGGTYERDYATAEGTSVKIAEGHVSVDNDDGTFTVQKAVAKIGDTYFATLIEAIAAAKAGNTIVFLADITEDVTVSTAVTIDGASKTYTGKMTLKANTTIKNVNFDGKGYNGYAVETRGAAKVVIEDCTAKNYGYGFLQVASSNDTVTVKNVTVSDVNYGVKIDRSNSVVLENVDITAAIAAVYNSNYGSKTITIKNSELSILGTWKRNDTIKTTYVFEGENTVDQFVVEPALDTFKLAAGATLTAPEGYNVTTDVADYKVVYEEGTYKLVAKNYVAEVNGKKYETLQEAIDACVVGDNVIQLLNKYADPITEDVTIKQTEGVNITIDGELKVGGVSRKRKYSGTITIHGNARFEGAETLTIKNIDFITSEASHYFIDSNSTGSVERYAHNVTISDCSFTAVKGSAAEHTAVAVRIRQGYNITIEAEGIARVTAQHMHSLFQGYGCTGVTFNNVNVNYMKNGIAVGTSKGVVFNTVQIQAEGYGIRADGTAAYDMIVKDANITANDPIVIRKASGAYKLTLEGSNALNASNTDGYQITFTNGDDGTYEMPTGKFEVTGADSFKVYPVAEYPAAIGSVNGPKYESLQAAIEAAQPGETVVLLKDIVLTEADCVAGADRKVLIDVVGKDITLNMNGKKISVVHEDAFTNDYIVAVIRVADGAGLTVTGNGTIDVKVLAENPDVAYMFWKRGTTGHLTVENGTYHMNDSADSMVYTNGNEIVKIAGGTWTLDAYGTRGNREPWIFNVAGAGDNHVIVVGGTFNADINRQHWSNEVLVPETYYTVDNGNGTWTVKAGAVAYVNTGMLTGPYFAPKDIGYATIEEAFAAADEFLDKNITLLQSVALTKDVRISLADMILNCGEFALDCGDYAIILTTSETTLTAPEGLNVTTNVAGMKVVYEEGTYKVVPLVYVAQIGDVKYETLAEAILFAQPGDTITLLANVSEDVTINKSITLDGAGFEYTGNISVSGSTSVVTVKNVNFVNGTGYAITTDRINTITVENCTVDNYGYGFLYANKSTPTVVVKNVTVDGGNYGFHWVYGTTATLENVTVTNAKYGLYIQNYAGKTIDLKNCDISSIAIWERSGYSGVQTFKFEGENKVGALSASQYAKYVLVNADATLTAPEGYDVTTTVAGSAVKYVDGTYKVIKAVAQNATTGEIFSSIQEAIDKAENDDEIVVLVDVELGWSDTVNTADGKAVLLNVEGKNIILNLNGKTITVEHMATEAADRIYAVVLVADGAGLTVIGDGAIDVTANETTPRVAYLFWKRGTTGYLVIEGGEYHMNHTEDSMVYTNGSDIVTVKGGSFTLDSIGTSTNGSPWIFNAQGTGGKHILITGGTFNADINRQHWSDEAVVDKTCYVVNNGDGTWTVKAGAVAYVNTGMTTGPYFAPKDIGYATIEEAFAAADEFLDENITLLQNVVLSKDVEISIPGIVLNANGYALDCNGHEIKLTAIDATLTAPEGLNVTTNIADMKVVYEDGVYKVTLKGAVVLKTEGSEELKYFDTIAAAMAEAGNTTGTDTIYLIVDHTEDIVLVYDGTTLDVQDKTLTAKYLVVFKGGFLTGNAYDKDGAHGQVKIDKDRVVITEGSLAQGQGYILPVWNEDHYVFGLYGALTSGSKYGFDYDAEADKIDLTFKVKATTDINDDIMKLKGHDDHGLSVIVHVEWMGSDGLVAQDYVYTDEMVQACAGKNLYTFSIRVGERTDMRIVVRVVSDTGATLSSAEYVHN